MERLTRVGLDLWHAADEHTGIGRYAARLVQALLAHVSSLDDHYRLTLHLGARDPAWLSDALATHGRLIAPAPRRWRGRRRGILTRMLRAHLAVAPRFAETAAQVHHSVEIFDMPVTSAQVRKVATVHDIIPILFPGTVSRRHWWMWRHISRPLLRRAHRLIAVSASTARDLCEWCPEVVDRVRVVYEGVDTRFAPAPADRVAAVRTRYWLPQEYLLFVGTVEPKKNVRGLVEAYRRLVARDNQIPPLVIAGRLGWMFEGVLQQVSEPKLQGRVRFLGPVPDDDLPALLSGASVFVFPSLYEGFGLPVLEAMACGVPVITSRISALPEVVGEAGLLVDPLKPDEISAAITLVLQDPRRAALMRERGLARAKEFSWEETARKTWQIYCEAIS